MALEDAVYFLEPVTEDIAPGYSLVIKQPMDLGTAAERLTAGDYAGPEGLARDVRLVWGNAAKYNGRKDPVTLAARACAATFDELWRAVELPGS